MDFLDTTIANVSLFHVAGSFGASHDQASWMLSSYLIAQAIMTTISGWLMETLGRKFYYMLSVATFTASSLACALVPDLSWLIVARIVQGVGGGGLASTEMSILVDTFPSNQRGKAMGIYAASIIFAPVIGPLLGGYLTDAYSWRWIFLINLPVGILSLALVQIFVVEPRALKFERAVRWSKGLSLDWLGFLLVILGVGSLQFVVARGQADDWFNSPLIDCLTLTSFLSLTALAIREAHLSEPIVAVRLFEKRNFVAAIALLLANAMLLAGASVILPRMLQHLEGYTATMAGLVLVVGAFAAMFTIPIASMLTDRVQARLLIGCAFALQALAFWRMTGLTTEISFWTGAVDFGMNGLLLPFSVLPLLLVAHVDIPERQTAAASAIVAMARHLGASIGVSMVETAATRQERFSRPGLFEHLTSFSPALQSKMQEVTHVLIQRGQSLADASQQAIAIIYRIAGQQAAMLAYIDTYWLMAECCVAAMPFVFLLKKARKGGAR